MRLAGLAVVAFVGSALAQPAGEQPAASPVEPSVELNVQREVALTIPEMVERANVALPAMERNAAVVRRLLAESRDKRDVVRVLCLNDKLNQMDLAIRTANDRAEALKIAAGQNNADQAKHEATVVNVLKDRVDALLTEANQCIGEQTGFVGDTQLTYTVDPRIPSDLEGDPTRFPQPAFGFPWAGTPEEMLSPPPVLSEPPLAESPIE